MGTFCPCSRIEETSSSRPSLGSIRSMTADIRTVLGSIRRVACLSSSSTDACARATVGLVRFRSRSAPSSGVAVLPIAFLSESPKTLRAMATPPRLEDFAFDFVGHARNGLDRTLVGSAVHVARFDLKDALLGVCGITYRCRLQELGREDRIAKDRPKQRRDLDLWTVGVLVAGDQHPHEVQAVLGSMRLDDAHQVARHAEKACQRHDVKQDALSGIRTPV